MNIDRFLIFNISTEQEFVPKIYKVTIPVLWWLLEYIM